MTRGHLRLENLGLAWPDGQRALEGIDLDVPAGTCLVLLGGSGAGKTTLLRIIAGLEKPECGAVVLDDTVLSGTPGTGRTAGSKSTPRVHVAPEDRGVGVVFQGLELWPHMSVAEHLAFALPGRPRGRRALQNSRVADLAAQVGLPARLLARRPANLSGGEQQRVAIARTLAAEPQVILYDEPLANLDPELRASLRFLIRQLAEAQGTTMIYVTHDPHEALEIGDAVAVMQDGCVVEVGVPSEVYAHPRTLAGAQALGPIVCLDGTVEGDAVHSPLGTHAFVAADGACRALWRPEGIRHVDSGSVTARVTDAILLGPDWQFHAVLAESDVSKGDITLCGRSSAKVPVGTIIHIAADTPASVLPPTRRAVAPGRSA